ncbi:MAG: SRPBCC domain-containing protein [Jatrophihabitans sp.]|uniref:SRPBCC domain-containing protein n=1 Tax=Jatrophihabitans sp. TaxID=1932789 RepID=UPI00391051FC
MEYASIDRELHIDASPDVVYDVVSSPEHIREWWDAETEIGAVAGAEGELVWTEAATGRTQAMRMTVVEADRPRLFSFRWTHSDGDVAAAGNSLLVTFELIPSGSGTTLHFSETGFREMGWEIAVLEEQYRDHENGWNSFLPRLAARADELAATP